MKKEICLSVLASFFLPFRFLFFFFFFVFFFFLFFFFFNYGEFGELSG